MHTNRGIPHDLERKAENMLKGQQFLHRKDDDVIQV
jgi:hypothetical protein